MRAGYPFYGHNFPGVIFSDNAGWTSASGVARDIPEGGRVVGIPAAPGRQARRQIVAIQQLPGLIHRMRELEKQAEQLTVKCASLEGRVFVAS